MRDLSDHASTFRPAEHVDAARAAAGPLRCAFTKNECGTDTWAVGCPCQCENCKTYVALSDAARAASGTAVVRDIRIATTDASHVYRPTADATGRVEFAPVDGNGLSEVEWLRQDRMHFRQRSRELKAELSEAKQRIVALDGEVERLRGVCAHWSATCDTHCDNIRRLEADVDSGDARIAELEKLLDERVDLLRDRISRLDELKADLDLMQAERDFWRSRCAAEDDGA